MYHFYFHIRQGTRILVDDEGMMLCDIQAAMVEADMSAHDLSRASLRAGNGLDNSVIEIADESGNILNPAFPRRLLN